MRFAEHFSITLGLWILNQFILNKKYFQNVFDDQSFQVYL